MSVSLRVLRVRDLLGSAAAAAIVCLLLPAAPMAGRQRSSAFVPPSATTRVADAPRTATLSSGYGQKFSADNTRPVVTVVNPYMDVKRPLFAKVESLQCAFDGRVIVSGRAGFDADGSAVATGFWQIAPDGAVTPLAVRSVRQRDGRGCGVPFAQSSVAPGPFSIGADGRLFFGGLASIMSLTPDGLVTRLAGPAGECSGSGATGVADGRADAARFTEPQRSVQDGSGNLWVADQSGCALRRIGTDGSVSTVLAKDRLCNSAVPAEDRPLLQTLAWDATHNELVAAGSTTVARPEHDLYTTVFRISPAGDVRRVLFAKKASRVSPAKHHLDGIRAMTVDPKGRILLISLLMIFEQRGFDALQLMRVDEPNATVVPLSGTKIPKGTWLAEHPLDGPLEMAHFDQSRDMCAVPDGTLYVNDEMLVRRVDPKGVVTTWAF